jgi:hypothetical protein
LKLKIENFILSTVPTMQDYFDYEIVFGLPNHLNIHDVYLDNPTLYGFSWITSKSKGWQNFVGSFDVLYKKYLEFLDDYEYFEDEDSTYGHAFFVLNENQQPIEVIKSVQVSPLLYSKIKGGMDNNYNPFVVLEDLSTMNDDVPRLEFKV